MALSHCKFRFFCLVGGGLCLGTLAYAAPLKIATTSPLTTEITFQMGHGANVVAGSYVSDMKLPQADQVGLPFAPSIERIVALGTDVVVIDPFYVPSGFYGAVKSSSIRSFEWRVSDVDSFIETSRRFAKDVFGEEKNAAVEKVAACVAKLGKPKISFRFLALAWIEPPVVFGKHAFLATLVERLGGENIAGFAVKEPYPQVSEEWLMRTQVDTVYFLNELPTSRQTAERAAERWWGQSRPKLISLSPHAFARASLSPFRNLNALESGAKIPEVCND